VTSVEANLCLPGHYAPVRRRLAATIEYDDVHGVRRRTNVDGWYGRVVAHELELLDGGFYLDTVEQSDVHHTTSAEIGSTRNNQHPEANPHMPALSVVTLPVELLGVPGSILRRPADPVALDDVAPEELRWLVREMFVLQHHLEGVGLAAPQVGLSLRLAVIDSGQGDPVVLLNPELLDRSDETETGGEGCLSLPWLAAPVERATAVKVRTHDLAGEPRVLEADGYLARVIQHELDHLDGVLYTDHLDDLSQLRRIDPETLANEAMTKLDLARAPETAQS
jgi:peptide deformylase